MWFTGPKPKWFVPAVTPSPVKYGIEEYVAIFELAKHLRDKAYDLHGRNFNGNESVAVMMLMELANHLGEIGLGLS